MNDAELQQWLVAHGQPVFVDGQAGPATRAAIEAAFTNTCAPAVTDADIEAFALRLQCSPLQIKAVAKVESGGAAFDDKGRPKILFERHLFHRFTDGKYSVAPFSNSKGGGYSDCSWKKLTEAACKDATAAFASVSWGRFQVLGAHSGKPKYKGFGDLGYPSPIDLAYSTVATEAAHYELLFRYVEANGLGGALRALSTNPETCRAFAKGYNGPSYAQFDYHNKLARAMR